MKKAAIIANEYIALWNETDGGRRARVLGESWESDASYVDPVMRGSGTREIDGLIAAVQTRFPGLSFKLAGAPDGHGEFVRFSWSLGPDAGEAPIEGSDVLVMNGDRVSRVIGFLDKVPHGA